MYLITAAEVEPGLYGLKLHYLCSRLLLLYLERVFSCCSHSQTAKNLELHPFYIIYCSCLCGSMMLGCYGNQLH